MITSDDLCRNITTLSLDGGVESSQGLAEDIACRGMSPKPTARSEVNPGSLLVQPLKGVADHSPSYASLEIAITEEAGTTPLGVYLRQVGVGYASCNEGKKLR